MKVKKYPKVEIGRNSSLFFAVGLNLMLLITYLLFEYKSYESDSTKIDIVQMDDMEDEDIDIISLEVPPPPPPPPPAAISEEIQIVEDVVEVEETIIESTEVSQSDAIEEVASVEDVTVDEIEEEIDVPFAVIENIPVYPGCEKGTKAEKIDCFQRSIQDHVKRNFKYPESALELGISGKVFVLFVINSEGRVSKIRTRGPDKVLEEEANRIISLLPKMTPGMQRGRAVNVPYSIPISFVLRE